MQTVGEVIAHNRASILETWTNGVRSAAFAKGLSAAELAGTVPDYLGSLGQYAGGEPVKLSGLQEQLIERHLSQRLRQGASLNEILTELAALIRCVSAFLEAEGLAARPTPGEIAGLAEELRLAVGASVRIFNEHLLEDEQEAKLYTRRLQKIAAEADFGHPPSLRKRMTEALAVVMEAMRAQTAALLLVDASSHDLIMSATAGDAHEVLERHIASIHRDRETLAGLIASRPGRTTSVNDVETTTLEVSEPLRQSGIHALLGVGISSQQHLRAVMYVGLRERRAFTASESRRLEGLGEAMAVHLENARLHAALREKSASADALGRRHELFVATLMHDLNGPIAAAKQAVRALDHGHGEAGEGQAATILAHLDRLEDMIDELVDAHHIRFDQPQPMHLAKCELVALAREAVDELRATFGARFRVTGDRAVEGIWSADLLRRALWNLGANAAKFGVHGGPVTIEVRRTDSGAVLTVHNEGPAVEPAALARLIQPFGSASAERGEPPGWGLGLTLVWGCADAHGGRVEVESHPGLGTSFRLVLPWDARPYRDERLDA